MSEIAIQSSFLAQSFRVATVPAPGMTTCSEHRHYLEIFATKELSNAQSI